MLGLGKVHKVSKVEALRGCYVVGVGFPMTTNRYSPPDYNDFADQSIESMCSTFIYDWAPKEDGIVTPRLLPPHAPSTPMKILPTSPVTVVLYWTLMAQIAQNLAAAAEEEPGSSSGGSAAAAELYLQTLMSRLSAWHQTALPTVAAAGSAMARAVISPARGRLCPWSGRPRSTTSSPTSWRASRTRNGTQSTTIVVVRFAAAIAG